MVHGRWRKMKILVTGDPNYGLCESILETFCDGNCTILSEKDDVFDQRSYLNKVLQECLSYDTFINSAKLSNFMQAQILFGVWSLWKQFKKKGRIISIGSDVIYKNHESLYALQKRALFECHKSLLYKDLDIRLCLINPGKLGIEGTPYSKVANLIKYVLESDMEITEISCR
jgi:hypothetical protein